MSGTNGNTPYTHVDKKAGDVIRSEDWNAAMNEVIRLNTAKVNREGVDLINGPLTIEEALNANNANLDGTLQAESIILREELSVPTITATDVTFSGTLQGTDITLSEGLTATELTVSQATINGPLTAESLTVATTLSITDSLTIGEAATPTGQTKLSVDGAIQAAQLNAEELTVANSSNGPNTKVTHEGLFFVRDQTTGESNVSDARDAITRARAKLKKAQQETTQTQQTLEKARTTLRQAEQTYQVSTKKVNKLRTQISNTKKQIKEGQNQVNKLSQQIQTYKGQIQQLAPALGINASSDNYRVNYSNIPPMVHANLSLMGIWHHLIGLQQASDSLNNQVKKIESETKKLQQKLSGFNTQLQKSQSQNNQHQATVKQKRNTVQQQQQKLTTNRQTEQTAEQTLEQSLNDPRLKSLAYGLDTRQEDSLVYNTYKHHRWNTRGEETMTLNESGLLSVKGLKVEGHVDVSGVVIQASPMQHRMYPNDPIIHQDIFEAQAAGVIKKLGNPDYNNTSYVSGWMEHKIIRYGGTSEEDGNGAELLIPEGYNTAWVRVLGDRWTQIKAYFLDGAKEQLGHWTGGWRAANCYCPDGSLSDGNNSGDVHDGAHYHQWVPIPTGRAGRIALISKQVAVSNGDATLWLSGVAFSKNPWSHAVQSAVGYHWGVNGGNKTALVNDWHKWNNDSLSRINPTTNWTLKVPVVSSGRDKLLYLIEHNANWNGCMHRRITVNGSPIERFMATYDNPFARHWNSKIYERYIAARIPANLIQDKARYLNVRIDLSKQTSQGIHFREIGTHDLDVPRSY